MSSALNGSSVIRCFEHSNAIEIRDGITDFYTGLSHTLPCWCTFWQAIPASAEQSSAEQSSIIIITNLFQDYTTVVLVCCISEREPDITYTWEV